MSKPVPDHPVVSEWREWWRTMLPFALLIAVGVAAVWPIIQPAPPKRVVIATGPEGSSYNDFAAEYAKYFADNGVKLEIRKTNGSRENYLLLADPKSGVDAALVQGGTALPPEQSQNLSAICAVSFEPLFILYRKEAFGNQPLTHLEQVTGKRVAVGKQEGAPIGFRRRCWRCTASARRRISRRKSSISAARHRSKCCWRMRSTSVSTRSRRIRGTSTRRSRRPGSTRRV
jgi:hypothetical protein